MPSFGLKAHTKHLLLVSSIVVVPMVAFTVVILVLVFDNLADYLHCPHEATCPESPLVNIISPSHYYIDFPATRLVFVSSLSSTISFALVGALMSIYAYCAAGRLTDASVSPNQNRSLPTSYQASFLIRLLNADYLSLWELSRQQLRRGTKGRGQHAKPNVLRASITVFCLAMLARYESKHCHHYFCANKDSIFVHAADSYLHIATEAVDVVQIFPQAPSQHQYSRAIDPWCFDNRETMGTEQNKNFWGCAVKYRAPDGSDDLDTIYFNNASDFVSVLHKGYGKDMMNFTDETGIKFAVVGPTASPSDADWQATSFALSSQCAPIPATACTFELDPDYNRIWGGHDMWFNCSKARGSPIDFSGIHRPNALSYTFFDFHKYMIEAGTSFITGGLKMTLLPTESISNVTEQEATQMFPSTWSWAATVGVSTNIPEDMTDQVWPGTKDDYKDMVVACNTTGKCPLLRACHNKSGPS
jgi:hypothetical protein